MFPIQKIAIQVEKRAIHKSTVNLYLQQTDKKEVLHYMKFIKKVKNTAMDHTYCFLFNVILAQIKHQNKALKFCLNILKLGETGARSKTFFSFRYFSHNKFFLKILVKYDKF